MIQVRVWIRGLTCGQHGQTGHGGSFNSIVVLFCHLQQAQLHWTVWSVTRPSTQANPCSTHSTRLSNRSLWTLGWPTHIPPVCPLTKVATWATQRPSFSPPTSATHPTTVAPWPLQPQLLSPLCSLAQRVTLV